MHKFSITKFVPEFLSQNPEQRFTARQIARWIIDTYPEATEAKRRASTARKVPLDSVDAMLQQIVAEIGSQRGRLERLRGIRTTEGRPRRYYFTERSEEEEAEDIVVEKTLDNLSSLPSISENDLYPLFKDYLRTELHVLSRRIDERKSTTNRGASGNRWLFPDIVGMEDLSANWDREVVDCAREYSDKKTKLWSFELKLKINGSNLRESFFQAVSNFTWSNLGYLVAVEFQGHETLPELPLLAGLHGIGIIRFDPDDHSSSEIMIPATERTEIDWGTVNRIAQQNPDFKEYIRMIRQFYQTGDSRPEIWRQV